MTHDQLLAFLHTIGCVVVGEPNKMGIARYNATDSQTPPFYPNHVFYVYWEPPGMYTFFSSHRTYEEITDPAEIAKLAQQSVGDYLLKQEKP